MRIAIVLFLIFSSIWSIEIDRDFLKKEIKNNPKDVSLKIILARTYISQSDFDEAEMLLLKVLHLEDNNQKALSLIEDMKEIKKFIADSENKKVSNSKKLISYSEKLYKNREYKDILAMHKVLKKNNILFDSRIDLNAVWSCIYIKDYTRAFKILKNSSLSSYDRYYLKIKIYEAKGEYLLSENLYLEALKDGDKKDIVLGLYELYLKQAKYKEAENLLEKYKNRNPKSSIVLAMQKKAPLPKKSYKPKGSFEIVKEEFFRLKDAGKNEKAFKELSKYIKKHPKHEQSALLLASHLYWDDKLQESFLVLKPFIDKTNNKKILTLYADILLQKAIKKHKAKNFDEAIDQYLAYYKIKKDTKIYKEIAELYFVQNKIEKSLSYYKAYLKSEPDDYITRFRYATTLEKQKQYKKSEKQYKKVASKESELYTLSLYRYASMLILQKDEQKWDKSRGVLNHLLKELEKRKPSKKRDTLLGYTKDLLEKVSKPMPKPQKYKDVMLLPGQKKIIEKNAIFEGSAMEKRDVFSVKSMFSQALVPENKSVQKDIEFNFHMLQDSVIDNISLGIRVNNVAKFKDVLLSMETKTSRVKADRMEYVFDSFYTHFKKQDLSLELGLNKYKDFEDLSLELSYYKTFAGHQMTFGVGYLNGAFVNSLAYMIQHRINAVQLSIYDAILLTNLKEAEVSVELNIYRDENINLNSWLNYPIYTIVYGNFQNSFSLTGNYLYNTKIDSGYFPARFFDGNYINIKPVIDLGENGKIGGIGGVGYSFRDENILYNYGLYAQISIYRFFDINIDCRHYQSGYSPDGANECYAKAAYKW